MQKAPLITREQILAIASRKPFVVHRYRYRDDRTRRMCLKMAREGLLVGLPEDGDTDYLKFRLPNPA